MIICVGESLVDVIPGEHEGDPERAVPGGGPMNAAVATARLGVPTAFVGRISTDANGDLIWAHLEASGVDLRAAERGPEPTARAIVTVRPVQSFRFEGDNTADASMTTIDLSPLGPGPHIVHAGTLGVFRGETARALHRMLDDFDGVVSFDPNIRPQVFPSVGEWLELAGPWLDRASVIKASDEDLDWMGMTIDDLLVRGATAVLRTAGPAGVDVHVKGHDPFTVASVRGEVADTVGAGDSFCGAVLAQLYRRKLATVEAIAALGPDTWREIVSFGVKAASITVGRLGADPPWASEIDEPATA
ncbi:MAG: carbohydrate kinase [Acidimicrobiia bacterium]|nr:carbohydrate kinase [Acidimicrobiia bacterium]